MNPTFICASAIVEMFFWFVRAVIENHDQSGGFNVCSVAPVLQVVIPADRCQIVQALKSFAFEGGEA